MLKYVCILSNQTFATVISLIFITQCPYNHIAYDMGLSYNLHMIKLHG